jgi:leucyl aminopeptidase
MKIIFHSKPLETAPAGYIRVRLTEDEKGIKKVVREGKQEIIEIGTGKCEEVSQRTFIRICRSVITAAKAQRAKRIAVQFDQSPFPALNDLSLPELGSLIAQNFEMANFEFRTFKTKPKEGWTQIEEVLICGNTPKDMQVGFKKGQVIGQEVNATRELANTPGGSLTPRGLAAAAKAAVKGLPVEVTTIGRAQIKKLGMGLLAGVGEGSPNEPTFTVLSYQGGKKTERPIVLVGKGITFDAGGLNLKPSAHIYEMHMDMSGAAAVMHAVALAAKLKVKKNVIALVPAAENLTGPNATRPGDIHTSLSGKTVEVTDTDAEGRLVLADAITYAKRFKPAVVIDVATLTGAVVVALGLYATGVMSRDDELAALLTDLGEESGDYVWPLPLWDEYESVVKSDFADLQNHSIANGRWGGAINGGIFLWQFAKELDCPWAHLDIAARMTSAPGDELAKGAAGEPVRLLLRFIETWDQTAKS